MPTYEDLPKEKLIGNLIKLRQRINEPEKAIGPHGRLNTMKPDLQRMINLNDFNLLITYKLTPCVQRPHLWVKISFTKGGNLLKGKLSV
jgi:hypothetical protein